MESGPRKWLTWAIALALVVFAFVNTHSALTQGTLYVSHRWRPGGLLKMGDPEFWSFLTYQVVFTALFVLAVRWKYRGPK